MSENSWPENDSCQSLELAESSPAGLSEAIALPLTAEDEDFEPSPLDQGFAGRRLKAAFVLTGAWSLMYLLHSIAWGLWIVWAITGLMTLHLVRAFFAKPMVHAPTPDTTTEDWPTVSVLVSAKNEEAVIEKLVRNLCALDYPHDRYDVWIIDDASTDRTAQILQTLKPEFANLNVFRRSLGATGGKSGALNQVLSKTQGEFLVVFDADAQIQPDFLQQTLPIFLADDRVGAVQLRKAVVQAEQTDSPEAENFWIQGQHAEMLLDAFMQQQRIAIGGLGELRGNGQMVRRQALLDCGGWNEETITDDLDLTFRLHLNHWDIHCFTLPPVYEEGVTTVKALWHQRNRWAEGGYQRYLDYWRLILRNRMGTRKTLDLSTFWIMQYFMPTAAVPDFALALARHHSMMLTPLSMLTFLFFVASTVRGLRRKRLAHGQHFKGPWEAWGEPILQSLQGFLYMMHWFVVVSSVTARMAIVPKRLKWVKTVHTGSLHTGS